jgi:hypothetical protein
MTQTVRSRVISWEREETPMKVHIQDRELNLRPLLSTLSLIAVAVLVLAFAPSASAGDPALRIQLTLEGPVPSNAAVAFGSGTSSAYICEPASATSTWPPGSVIVPPCLKGHSYGDTSQVPPGTRVSYHFDLSFCQDATCNSTTATRTIWKGQVTMGRTDTTVNVTYTFGGLPNTSTSEAPSVPPRGTFRNVTLLIAALLGLGIGARRFARRGPAFGDVRGDFEPDAYGGPTSAAGFG